MPDPKSLLDACVIHEQACPILHANKLLDSSLDVICSIDGDGRFLALSAACEKVWGYAPGELKGRPYLELVVPEDRDRTIEIAAQIMSGAEITDFENQYQCKDGSRKPILWSARWDREEQIMYCVARDATQRRQAEQRARLQEERLYRAYKLSGIGWWEWTLVGENFFASDELYTLYGLSREAHPQITVQTFSSMVHPEDQAFYTAQSQRMLNRDVDQYEYSHRLIRPDGKIIVIHHDVRIERNAAGEPVFIHGTTKDITRARLAQQELEDSERRLAQYSRRLTNVLESLEEGFFTVDRNWTVTYWNQRAEVLLQRRRESILYRNLWTEFADAISLKFYDEYHRAMAEGQPRRFEEFYPARQIWAEVSVYPNEEGLSIFFRDITARKAREQQLRISNERFSFVSQATSDVIWDWDLKTRAVHINDSFTRIFGYQVSDEHTVSQIWSSNLHLEDKERVVHDQLRALRNQAATIWEDRYRFFRADGSMAYVNDRAVIIRDGEGRAIRMIGAIQDVTRQREAELEVERREKQFRAMVQSGKDITALADARFNIHYISPNHEEMIGYPIEQLKGATAYRFIHPDDFVTVFRQALGIFDQHMVQLPSFRFRMPSGEYRWAEVVLTNHLDDPDIRALVINARDITAKKQAFDDVRKLSMVAEQISSSVVIAGPDGRIQWVNNAFTRRTGYELEEVAGQRPRDFLHHPGTDTEVTEYISRCMEKKLPFHCELINLAKNGRMHWVELKGQPIFGERGELTYYLSTQDDITPRKEAEELMRRSESNYKLLFYKSPTPKWIFDAETNCFTDVNDAALELYGYSRAEFLSMNLMDIRPPEERPKMLRIIREREERKMEAYSGIVRHNCKDGRVITVQVNSHLMALDEGNCYLVEIQDITEKLELEQMVIDEKIAAEREVAKAIIATQEKERSEIGKELHDNVNQILTTAKLYVENIHYYPEQQSQFVQKSSNLIQKTINEVRGLSKALVTPTIRDMGFRETIQELVDYYLELNLFVIELHFTVQEHRIDREVKLTLYRILQEQFNNTVKHAEANAVTIRIEEKEKRVVLDYADDGRGFDTLSRKVGQGLSNMKNRAEVYHGRIDIWSAPGQGCRIRVSFPMDKPDGRLGGV